MTEPTDYELAKLFTEETGFDVDDFPAAILDFARAVLARWGQPSGAVPLSIAEEEQMLAQWDYEMHGDRARYIEAAHGIGIKGGQHGAE